MATNGISKNSGFDFLASLGCRDHFLLNKHLEPMLPMMQVSDAYVQALSLMELPVPEGVDECSTKTPAAKRPKLASQVELSLEITPPPVLGPQSETGLDSVSLLYIKP